MGFVSGVVISAIIGFLVWAMVKGFFPKKTELPKNTIDFGAAVRALKKNDNKNNNS